MPDEDLPLVEALQAGNDAALDELMRKYKTPLFSFISRYVRNEADAEDLAQETFVRAYFHIRAFRPHAKFVTWLYTIATNLCRDHVRSRWTRNARQTQSLFEHEEPEDLPALAASPDQRALVDEQLASVEKAISELPHDLRTALILTALEGLSHIEAAERLGITAKTVETRVYRARKRLEAILVENAD